MSTDLFGDVPKKKCKACSQFFPAADFPRCRATNGKSYLRPYCRPCFRIKLHRWHHTPAGQRAHRKGCLRAQYGMTPEDYDALLQSQNGLCAICKKPERRLNRAGKIRHLAVDHDHATGAIRGLLCSSCNNGIGYFGDDLTLLRAAVAYLEDHDG